MTHVNLYMYSCALNFVRVNYAPGNVMQHQTTLCCNDVCILDAMTVIIL